MKTLLSILALTFVAASFSNTADAQRRLRLEMGDQIYRGQSVIGLKQELRRQYPNIRPRNLMLSRVVYVAKTRAGRGTATLVVNNFEQDRRTVMGSPQTWNDLRPRSYDRVRLANFDRRARGPWQLHLRGHHKVRAIILVVQRNGNINPPPPRPRPLREVSLGTDKADKVLQDHETFQANHNNVMSVQIVGVQRKVDIHDAYAVLGNGQRIFLPELTGRLRSGNVKSAQLRGRYVQYVGITATSPNLTGGRGKYEVKLLVR